MLGNFGDHAEERLVSFGENVGVMLGKYRFLWQLRDHFVRGHVWTNSVVVFRQLLDRVGGTSGFIFKTVCAILRRFRDHVGKHLGAIVGSSTDSFD